MGQRALSWKRLEPEGPSVSCLLLWSECWHPSTIHVWKPGPNMVRTWSHWWSEEDTLGNIPPLIWKSSTVLLHSRTESTHFINLTTKSYKEAETTQKSPGSLVNKSLAIPKLNKCTHRGSSIRAEGCLVPQWFHRARSSYLALKAVPTWRVLGQSFQTPTWLRNHAELLSASSLTSLLKYHLGWCYLSHCIS